MTAREVGRLVEGYLYAAALTGLAIGTFAGFCAARVIK